MGLCRIRERITMNLRNTSYRWLGIAALTATALLLLKALLKLAVALLPLFAAALP